MIDPNSLEAIYCPCCHKPAGQVIHAESNTRKGWWCEHCGHWVDAIARERLVETDNLQERIDEQEAELARLRAKVDMMDEIEARYLVEINELHDRLEARCRRWSDETTTRGNAN